MSGGVTTWLVALGSILAALGVPIAAEANHPKPGSDVPWVWLIVGAVAVFAAAWGLTVYFERRQKTRSPEPREHAP